MADEDLTSYPQAAGDRSAEFAARRRVLVAATAFGGTEFPGYREKTGHPVRPGRMVNDLVGKLGGNISPVAGRFSLHGDSVGSQFAARYLVTHPYRLEDAVLSAPWIYPMPDPALA